MEIELNKEQREAVTHGEGPLLVVAGAGTGKTTVLTKRLSWVIREGMAEPEEVLALTFSDKAAEEMERRVDRELSESYLDLWVMTFHSFARRVLKERGLDIGLPTDFNLLDQTDSWLLVRKNLEKFDLDYYKPLGRPTKFIHALVSHFSRCKDQGISPDDYLEYARGLENEEERSRLLEVAEAYETYQHLLLNRASLDFGDLINYTVRLFRERENILARYREKFEYLLVDEFQDTNRAQYDLMKILAAPDNNLTVTSDDDQAIYRFRGASFGNIVQFRKDYPEAKTVSIVKNYRSKQNILDLAHRFIQKNNPNRLEVKEGVDKRLLAQEGGEGRIGHLHFKTLEGEVRGTVNKVIELEEEEETTFGDFALLVRSNKAAHAFCRTLERAGVPYRFLAHQGLYFKPVVLDIINYFKVLEDRQENKALYRVLNIPPLRIQAEDIARLARRANKKSVSLYRTLKKAPEVSEENGQGVERLLSIIEEHTELARRRNTSEVLVSFLEESGYLDHLTRSNDLKGIRHVNQFYSKIKAFERANRDGSLSNFMAQMRLELESGEEGRLSFGLEKGEEVKVMTIHRAKGLEFKYVFLVNLVKRRFPTIKRRRPIQIPKSLVRDIIPEGDIHLEEERRLFYVGMTRARQGLFFTSAEDYGGVRKKKPSRFLKEAGVVRREAKRAREMRDEVGREVKREKGGGREERRPEYFSYTQFRAFENCPLQYKYAHVLKIPIRGKAVFSYGKSLHRTLERFIRESRRKELDLEDLLAVYEEEWVDNWFHSREEREKYFKQGRESLRLFYQDFKEGEFEVLEIEGQPALEVPFRLKVGEETVVGKIDRIDEGKKGARLLDYKTGKVRERLRKKDREQLLIYQIAAEEALGLEPETLSYYYLDGGKRLSFLGDEEAEKEQKEKMKRRIKKIKESEFQPTPGWQCRYCDFKEICEYANL